MNKLQTKRSVQIYQPPTPQPLVHVETQPIVSVPNVTGMGAQRLLILVMCGLFMLAYAGVDIAHIASYVVPIGLIHIISYNIYKRQGLLVGVLSAGLMISLSGYAFFRAQDLVIALGASLQRVSIAGLIVCGVLFLMTLKSK